MMSVLSNYFDVQNKIDAEPSQIRKLLITQASLRTGNSGGRWSSFDALLLELGVSYSTHAQPSRVPTMVPKQCFANAHDLAWRRRKGPRPLLYVEGYAARFFPVHHAWCVDPRDGTILDPTWSDKGIEYLGLPLKLEWFHYYLSTQPRSRYLTSALYNPSIPIIDTDPAEWLATNEANKR